MPVTNTKVGLCNEALSRLGSAPIESFDEGSDKATACSLAYEATLAKLLAMRQWRFASDKATLSRLVDAPENEWTYAYQLPSDSLGLWAVFDNDRVGARPMTRYEVYGDKLLTDAETVVVDYKVEPQIAKFPVYFRELMVLALCEALAPRVTEQTDLVGYYRQQAFGTTSDNFRGGWYAVAAQSDAQGSPSDRFNTDEITAARFS